MEIIEELSLQLRKGNAHVSFAEAVKDIPFKDIQKKPEHVPYSIWELAEHMRITQSDILEFCRNPEHVSPPWPDGYWTAAKSPGIKDWEDCLAKIESDREDMITLLEERDTEELFEPFSYGTGQSLFREAMVMADHTAYHTGQIVVLRRLLGNWG